MRTIKIVGILLIIICCSMAGYLKSCHVKNRVKKLSLIYDGVQLLFEYIQQGKCELEKAVRKSFFKCGFIKFEKQNIFCSDFDLNVNDIKIVNEFFDSLGYSTKKAECDRIKAFSLVVQKRLNEAESERAQKSKIYQTFGVCIGLLIGILLI